MIKKCTGCGVSLQTIDSDALGYTREMDNDQCERCFRIRNYGDYKVVTKDNSEYIKIINNINKTGDLVLLVVDLFNLNKEVYELSKLIKNPCLLVLTKRDIFAKDIHNSKFTEYMQELPVNLVDSVMVSSKNNYNFDLLFSKIKKYKMSKNVYIVGLTNAGKSTMINKLLQNYSQKTNFVTTSMLPSTTIDTLEIPVLDDLVLIDTPGIIDKSITNKIDTVMLKKITPKKTIRPITFQIKASQSIVVEDLLRLDIEKWNSVTLFFANNLQINRYYKDHDRLLNLEKHVIKVPDNSDILISGLGFIKIISETTVTIYTIKGVEVSIRKALV